MALSRIAARFLHCEPRNRAIFQIRIASGMPSDQDVKTRPTPPERPQDFEGEISTAISVWEKYLHAESIPTG